MKVPSENNKIQANKDLSHMDLHLTKEGSLGLLAYGDLGLMAWRKVRQESKMHTDKP